jgi:hypothetical protein
VLERVGEVAGAAADVEQGRSGQRGVRADVCCGVEGQRSIEPSRVGLLDAEGAKQVDRPSQRGLPRPLGDAGHRTRLAHDVVLTTGPLLAGKVRKAREE